MAMRINRYIAASGLTSRRGAEDLVRAGRVQVNGTVVTDLACQVEEGDQVLVDGQAIQPEAEVCLYLFHKPAQVLCSRKDPAGRPLVYDYFPASPRLFTVGRLDYDSEGLILLTNLGDLAHALAHPSQEVEKEYLVYLNRPLEPADRDRILQGVTFEGESYQLDQLLYADQKTQDQWAKDLADWPPAGPPHRLLRAFLHEGKKREIRQVFKSQGYQVLRLIRVAQGDWTLAGLQAGQARKVESAEIQALRRSLGLAGSGEAGDPSQAEN
jgi:23S rRNA pseudouridine2605 synthase